MPDGQQYDVAIVGASLAGCTAARLLGLQGLSVALIEQHPALDWHKRLCTHYIQACAAPTIERLGLAPLLDRAGAVRSRMEIWTRWGWIKHPAETPPQTYGYGVRRQTLDPLVRRLAAETPGVDLLLGWTAQRLIKNGERFSGIAVRDRNGQTREIAARLIVAADGRNSSLAELAHSPARSQPNNRFTYFAYYRNVSLSSGNDSQFWMLDPDVGYALRNEDGVTLLACWVTKNKLLAFREDRIGSFERFMRALPGGPNLDEAKRISEISGALDLPVMVRGGSSAGLAFIGDAALAADPLWGVGCGWAFQSAQWLADCIAPALLANDNLDRALKTYHKRHRQALGGHYLTIADYARGRPFRGIEKLYYRAAARNEGLADLILGLGARRVQPQRLLAPTTLARAVWHALRPAAPEASGVSPKSTPRESSRLQLRREATSSVPPIH